MPAAQDGQPPSGRPAQQWARRHGPGPHGGLAASPGEAVLIVAACAGPRCRALRVLCDPSAASGPCGRLLREAVRQRPAAVLVSTGCLGPCHRACVAAVGWGEAHAGRLRWSGQPAGLGLVEVPARAAALAAWIAGSAPDPATLPEALRLAGTG